MTAGVIPPPVKDKRGRRRYKTNRTTGLHALRHYFASITLADGVNIKKLSEYLGHDDPGFTLQMYTHMLPSSYDRARRPPIGAPCFAADGAGTEQGRFDRRMRLVRQPLEGVLIVNSPRRESPADKAT